MIEISIERNARHLGTVRFFGKGVFDRYNQPAIMDAKELAQLQCRPFSPEPEGYEVISGEIPAEVIDLLWEEIQKRPVSGQMGDYEWMLRTWRHTFCWRSRLDWHRGFQDGARAYEYILGTTSLERSQNTSTPRPHWGDAPKGVNRFVIEEERLATAGFRREQIWFVWQSREAPGKS